MYCRQIARLEQRPHLDVRGCQFRGDVGDGQKPGTSIIRHAASLLNILPECGVAHASYLTRSLTSRSAIGSPLAQIRPRAAQPPLQYGDFCLALAQFSVDDGHLLGVPGSRHVARQPDNLMHFPTGRSSWFRIAKFRFGLRLQSKPIRVLRYVDGWHGWLLCCRIDDPFRPWGRAKMHLKRSKNV